MTTRSVQVGDYAELHIGEYIKQYPITRITRYGIFVDDNGTKALLIPKGKSYQVKNFSPSHSIKFLANINVQDSSIDATKVLLYMTELSQDEKRFVQKVISVTRYIRRDELIGMMKKCIEQLEQNTPKYNLFIPEGKIGSEHWLIHMLEYYLHPVRAFYGTEDLLANLTDDFPLVIMDDAVYTGNHMSSIIDEQIRYETGIKNKVIALAAVSNGLSPQFVIDEYFNAELITALDMSSVSFANLFGTIEDNSELADKFGINTDAGLPLYFDHKIANEFGSYQFYHKIIKNPVSRKEIEQISIEDIMDIVHEMNNK